MNFMIYILKTHNFLTSNYDMINKIEYFIAWRYLRAKKQESFISVVAMFSLIGTALGVAALIAVMAVMAGVREEWTQKLIGAVGDINIYAKSNAEIENYSPLIQKIVMNPKVVYAIPVIEKQVLVSADENNFGVQLRGINSLDLEKKSIVSNNIVAGSIKKMNDDSIIIGSSLANSLHVYVGDSVKLISPQTSSTFIGNIPRLKTVKIVAIFDSGMPDFDSNVIFTSLELAQIFFKMKEQINLIEVTTSLPNDVDIVKKILNKRLNKQFRIIDWKQRNAAFMGALQTEKIAMFVILTLIMIVAAFNIISSLIMLVKDKTSDIAILRTMGANKQSIVKIFLICGTSIGFIGTILGVILGISFASNIENIRLFLQGVTGTAIFDPVVYFLAYLPAKLYPSDVVTITCMSLSLSFLATIYPAYRAAKLNPVTALKYA